MYRPEFQGIGVCTPEVCIAQARQNLGHPMLPSLEPHDIPLAVVGGGPSSGKALNELKEWPGHIWAINQGASWLSHMAPKALVWLFAVDPEPFPAQWFAGVERAILGSTVHPSAFEALKFKDVRMFNTLKLNEDDMCLGGGPCAATKAGMQAAWQGYKSVTFYGCEGSIEVIGNRGITHSYRSEERPRMMVVKCGNEQFITTPDLYINTHYLAQEFREYHHGWLEKCGGLLRGMLEYPDTWEVVAYSTAMRDQVDPTSVEPYQIGQHSAPDAGPARQAEALAAATPQSWR